MPQGRCPVTGPEHYRAAERLAREAATEDAPEWVTARAALAQVHATLALAAATAMGLPAGSNENWTAMPDADARAWYKAAGEQQGGAEYVPQEGDEVVAEDGTRWRAVGLPMPGERRIVLRPSWAEDEDRVVPRRVRAVINAHGPLTLARREQPADGAR